MAISKLSKIIIVSLLIISIIFTCSKIYKRQNEFENKQNDEIENCKNNFFVAQKDYKILFNQYNLIEFSNLSVFILRKGKSIKVPYQSYQSEKYISFSDDKILKSDTLLVNLRNDIYYIHSFENDFWLGYKPYKCFLNSYKINNKNYVEERELNYGDKYSDSSPSVKEFILKKQDLIQNN